MTHGFGNRHVEIGDLNSSQAQQVDRHIGRAHYEVGPARI
jgi:hypothetical protein